MASKTLILRSRRRRRLEGWPQHRSCRLPSRRIADAMLLRMRAVEWRSRICGAPQARCTACGTQHHRAKRKSPGRETGALFHPRSYPRRANRRALVADSPEGCQLGQIRMLPSPGAAQRETGRCRPGSLRRALAIPHLRCTVKNAAPRAGHNRSYRLQCPLQCEATAPPAVASRQSSQRKRPHDRGQGP